MVSSIRAASLRMRSSGVDVDTECTHHHEDGVDKMDSSTQRVEVEEMKTASSPGRSEWEGQVSPPTQSSSDTSEQAPNTNYFQMLDTLLSH